MSEKSSISDTLDIWQQADAVIKKQHIPIHIVFEITHQCNLQCIHCYNTKDQASLTLSQIKNIAEQLREAGCLFLTLTGGEIFIRDDIKEILFYLKELGFDLKIITNGTAISDDILDVLTECAPSEIGVSLLGATAKTHDAITQSPGSFKLAIDAINRLKENNLPVHIKCTIMEENVAEYQKILELADQWGITHILDPLVSPKDNGCSSVLIHRLSSDKLRSFYEEVWRDYDMGPVAQTGFPCEAGTTFGAISANGEVYPCIQYPKSLGNVLKENFSDIWKNHAMLKEIRQAQQSDFKECQTCDLSSFCTRCPGLAYLEDGDAFGCSTSALNIAKMAKQYQQKNL